MMKLPTPAELTEPDREAIAKIVAQADGLADRVLATEFPDIRVWAALHGLSRLAAGCGLFTLSDRHAAALGRLPQLADLAAWAVRESRMEA